MLNVKTMMITMMMTMDDADIDDNDDDNYRKISSIMRTILSSKCWSEVGVRIIHV